MTIVKTRAITGGVDTHADVHVAAALDPIGGLPGVQEFPATAAGYAGLLGWLGGFGTVALVGIEGTGSYGAGLARHVTRPASGSSKWTAPTVRTAAARVSPTRWMRSVPPGPPSPAGPGRAEGPGRRGRGDPGADGRQAQRPLRAGPDDRPGQGPGPDRARRSAHPVHPAHGRRPGQRPGVAAAPARRRRRLRHPHRAARAGTARGIPRRAARAPRRAHHPARRRSSPGLLALYGVGPDTAALLLVAAGDHPERLRSEAAWAHLCAAAPLQASSGKVTRYRLNPGGDRQASHALWRIVITRMSAHPPALIYAGRRTREGRPKNEIIRCLKRYVAREVYRHLRAAG